MCTYTRVCVCVCVCVCVDRKTDRQTDRQKDMIYPSWYIILFIIYLEFAYIFMFSIFNFYIISWMF